MFLQSVATFCTTPVAMRAPWNPPMLVIYTDYDPVATALAGCAARFLDRHRGVVTACLAPTAADWEDPHAWIGSRPSVPLVFFGHGSDSPAGLVSQHQACFLDAPAAPLLAGRLVCGVCCFSAGLGGYATAVGATVVGYRDILQVVVRPQYATLLADCVMAGLEALAAGETAATICRATQNAYERLAQKLFNGSPLDCLVAPVFQGNAQGLAVVGDLDRRP